MPSRSCPYLAFTLLESLLLRIWTRFFDFIALYFVGFNNLVVGDVRLDRQPWLSAANGAFIAKNEPLTLNLKNFVLSYHFLLISMKIILLNPMDRLDIFMWQPILGFFCPAKPSMPRSPRRIFLRICFDQANSSSVHFPGSPNEKSNRGNLQRANSFE